MLPTSPTTPNWPPEGWLTKKTAADRLGLSESRVAALGSSLIKTQGQRSPHTNQYVTLFHAGDVERVAYERQNPGEITKSPAKLDRALNLPALNGSVLPGVVAPVERKPWLTVAEAAEYCGLPESMIRVLLEDATQLKGIDCGPRPGGKWRIRKVDLDRFNAAQQ